MKTVLIVSPRFPPVNAPDHQRVRMMLPDLHSRGWEPVVLCVAPEYVEGSIEQGLLATIPSDVEVIRVNAVPHQLTRRAGFAGLAFRAHRALRNEGDRLLRERKFDLVFFSTTEFGLIPLGRRWKKLFGVPYVVDLQDPWVNTHYEETGAVPPGGRLKHRITQSVARLQEGPTLRDADQVVSVSAGYVSDLANRYANLDQSRFSVIPFGGSRLDLAAAKNTQQTIFAPADGKLHWVYAGTAPPGIRLALTALLTALKRAFDEGILRRDSIRLHFIGTDYAPAALAKPRVAPIALSLGMDDVLIEHPARIPYLEVLRCLEDSDAALILGWNDPGYTASKLYPYILAEKPLLSILHEKSSANQVMRDTRAGVPVTFNENDTEDALSRRVFDGWFSGSRFALKPETIWTEFAPYTAESMTEKVVAVFDRITVKAPSKAQ